MEFIIRALTSTILIAFMIILFLFLTPFCIAITILLVYGYAFFIEYIPLLYKSFSKIPIISTITGIALIITGVMHALWLYDPVTHLYVMICIIAAVLSDSGGYIVGNLCGKHPLVPSISPKKTWEGFVGSIIITSFLFGLCIHDHYVIYFFGATLAGAALAGDLLFSYIKRVAGVKDTGNILPGHGGILDRLDSIIGTTIMLLLLLLLLKVCYQINLFDEFTGTGYHIF